MSLRTLKSTLLLLLFFISFHGSAQFRRVNLQDDFEGPWVLIHAQRIDGSRIITRTRYIEYFGYTFAKDRIIQVDSITYSAVATENNLSIIDAKHATRLDSDLELISDSLLVVTDKYDEYSLDKKNKFVFLKKDRYLKFLKTTPWFVREGDSTLVANGHIFPMYKSKNLAGYLSDRISPCVGVVSGYFIVDKNKKVVDVQLVENKKFDKWEWLVTALRSTSGDWDLPMEGYRYKVPFTLGATKSGAIDITFKARDFDWFAHDHLGLSGKQISAMISLFDRGTQYLETNKFDKAIADFTTCIAIDPIYLDAYYNRAYAYLQLKQLDNACKDWRFLKDLEQVTGTKLFEQNCKKER